MNEKKQNAERECQMFIGHFFSVFSGLEQFIKILEAETPHKYWVCINCQKILALNA